MKPTNEKADVKAAQGARIEQRIEIDAPAERIWALLCDVDRWSRWNPLYVRASGAIRVGGAIDLAVALPGLKPQLTRATILEAVERERLRYQTRTFGGLLRGVRYVNIERRGAEACSVTNGEIMGGLLAPVVARAVGSRVEAALRLMNEALKAVAEAM